MRRGTENVSVNGNRFSDNAEKRERSMHQVRILSSIERLFACFGIYVMLAVAFNLVSAQSSSGAGTAPHPASNAGVDSSLPYQYSQEAREKQKEIDNLYFEASGGDINAQYKLGAILLEGKWVAKDVDRGLALLKLAAAKGHAGAREKLAQMDAKRGTLVDLDEPTNGITSNAAKKAFEDQLKKAQSGDAGSQYVLGVMYLKGYRVAKDIGAGMALLKSARRNGHAESRLVMFLMEKKGTSKIRDHFPTIKELRQEYDPQYALNEEQFLDALGGGKGVSGKDLKRIIESPPVVSWDSLTEKPPVKEPNYFEQQNASKPSVLPTPTKKTFVDFDKPTGSSGSSGLFDDVLKDTSEQPKAQRISPVASSFGTVAIGLALATACAVLLWFLMGKNVPGVTPLATGRRWMNKAAPAGAIVFLTKFFSQWLADYGNPGNSLAIAILGIVVWSVLAFGCGAIWSLVRPRPHAAVADAPDTALDRHGLNADDSRMYSTSNVMQSEPITIPKSNNDVSIDQTMSTRKVVSEQIHPPIFVTVPTADEESNWAAAMAEVASGQLRPGIWAKAFAEANGDDAKAKAAYLKVRVQQLSRL